MKMVLVAYCEAADYDIIESLKRSGMKGYTKFTEVLGEGVETNPRLGTQCWPGKNNFLAIAVDDNDFPVVISRIKTLKARHPKAGIKAFVLPMEDVI